MTLTDHLFYVMAAVVFKLFLRQWYVAISTHFLTCVFLNKFKSYSLKIKAAASTHHDINNRRQRLDYSRRHKAGPIKTKKLSWHLKRCQCLEKLSIVDRILFWCSLNCCFSVFSCLLFLTLPLLCSSTICPLPPHVCGMHGFALCKNAGIIYPNLVLAVTHNLKL